MDGAEGTEATSLFRSCVIGGRGGGDGGDGGADAPSAGGVEGADSSCGTVGRTGRAATAPAASVRLRVLGDSADDARAVAGAAEAPAEDAATDAPAAAAEAEEAAVLTEWPAERPTATDWWRRSGGRGECGGGGGIGAPISDGCTVAAAAVFASFG